jgi:6-phosphogluconolactonase
MGDILVNHAHAGSGPSPRQSKSHPHGCFFSPDGQLAVVPDLGADKLVIYRIGGSLEPAEPPLVTLEAGSGPRQVVFHPSGEFGYVLCELSSTVTAFHCRHSRIEPFATVSALPPEYRGANIGAGIAIDDSGRFLYCSNRGADTIAVFAVGVGGEPVLVQHIDAAGRTPRHIAIDPSGEWLAVANQDSDAVSLLPRNPTTGRLATPARRFAVPKPACIMFACPRALIGKRFISKQLKKTL